MKNIIKLSAFAFVFGACASVFTPQGSIRQIANSPLMQCETCWIPNGDIAEVYIGRTGNRSLRISDPAALRGSRVRQLEDTEFSVSAESAFIYNPATKEYKTTFSTTNSIIVTVPATFDVTGFSYMMQGAPEGDSLLPQEPWSRKTENGNTCIIEAARGSSPYCIIKNIRVYARAYGDGDGYNDLTTTTYLLRDSIGQFDFADLRTQLIHFYDGNRGEDWSEYRAKSVVNLADNPIRFNANGDFTMRVTANTNLVVQQGVVSAITVSKGTGSDIQYTYFTITDILVGNDGTVTLSYAHDITGFDLSGLAVAVCDRLEDKVWYSLAEDEYTATSDTIVIAASAARSDKRFYKLIYFGAMSNAVKVTLRGTIVVNDTLILKGTDDKLYKISVSGGTISAQEVTL